MSRPTSQLDPEAVRRLNTFRQRLDETHEFPCEFVFKFIVPATRIEELEQTLAEALGLSPSRLPCRKQPSRNGRYISLTLEIMVESSEHVSEVYTQAATVPDLIAL